MDIIYVIGYISFLLSLSGIILNSKKNIWCWPIWIMSNIGWIYYSFLKSDYPTVMLWAVFLLSNIYGWISWSKNSEK